MSFQLTCRASLLRGLFLCAASSGSVAVHAQELSSPTPWTLGGISAPNLKSKAPISRSSDIVTPIRPRATRPNLPDRLSSNRLTAILPPPDNFYQTPAQLEPWMFELAKTRPSQVRTRILGKTPGGRNIVALEVVPKGVSPWKVKRLVVLCRQHGNEPEASASGLRFVREFLTTNDPKKRKIASKTALLIVPIANPDGAAVYRRRTDKNVDMNRDWGRRKSREVALLTKWVSAWKPHLMVDVHQWLPNERQPPPMAEASGGTLARRTAQRMAQNSASRGYWLAARSRWGLDTLSHRYWGQRFKVPSILLETRHRPNESGARDVAIGTSLAALWSAAETVSK